MQAYTSVQVHKPKCNVGWDQSLQEGGGVGTFTAGTVLRWETVCSAAVGACHLPGSPFFRPSHTWFTAPIQAEELFSAGAADLLGQKYKYSMNNQWKPLYCLHFCYINISEFHFEI